MSKTNKQNNCHNETETEAKTALEIENLPTLSFGRRSRDLYESRKGGCHNVTLDTTLGRAS